MKKRVIRWTGTAAFWLAIWQLIYWIIGKELIIPSFLHTLEAFLEMMVSPLFYESVAATMWRVVLGITSSAIFGILFSILAYRFCLVRGQLNGIATVMKATPVLAIVLYLVLWMPSSHVPTLVCFLMCYPAVYTNVLSGLDHMDIKHLELAKVYRLKYIDRLKAIYIPSVRTPLKAALSLIAGWSWKTVVAGEVLSIPKSSMGYQLMTAKLYFETAQLFAWMFSIVVLSIIFEKIIKAGLRWL